MGNPIRFFKIRTVTGTEKYGLCCRDLKGLRKKACAKFKLPSKKTRVCLYEDGTILSDKYLMILPDQTELVLLTPGQTWKGRMTDVEHCLNVLCKSPTEMIEAARRMRHDGRAAEMRAMFQFVAQKLDDNSAAEERKDDQHWFEGIAERFKNKSSYMRESCKRRMRSYMREVQGFDVDPAVKDEYEELVRTMNAALRKVDFNGNYFDRNAIQTARLCTAEGWFSCQGIFDKNDCLSNHSINPYSDRESRMVFTTWNLDHVIEKKRTILPRLTRALEKSEGRKINSEYFFNLLFTTENLKLVQISCHEKSAHKRDCNEDMIYIKIPAKRLKMNN